MNNKTVYVLKFIQYSTSEIQGIYSSRESAYLASERLKDDDPVFQLFEEEIEEWEVEL